MGPAAGKSKVPRLRRLRSPRLGALVLLGWALGAEAHAAGAVAAVESGPAAWVQRLSPTLRGLDAEREALEARLAVLPRPASGPTSESLGYHAGMGSRPDEAKWVQVDLGAGEVFDLVVLVPVHHSHHGTHAGPGYGFPVRFRVETAGEPDFQTAQTLADYSREAFPNPGDEPVFIPAGGRRGRYVRVTATELWPRGEHFTFALGELLVLRGDRHLAAGRPVTALDSIENPRSWSRRNLVDFQSILGVPSWPGPSPSNGYHSREFEPRADVEKWVEVDLGAAFPLDELRLVPARPTDWADRLGFGFPLRFRIEAAGAAPADGWRTVVDLTGHDHPGPGANLVAFRGDGRPARRVRITATRHWERTGDYAFALAELQVFAGTNNAALGAAVTALESHEGNGWSTNALVDGFSSHHRLAPLGAWLDALEQRGRLLGGFRRLEVRRATAVRQLAQGLVRGAAYGLALVLAAGAAAMFALRVARHRELERTRARIARDMHDDLGARLTEITHLSELARREAARPDRAREITGQIAGRARDGVAALDELVWTVNPRNDSLPKLIGYVLRHAERFLEATPVRCRIDAPLELPGLPVPSDARHHILMIVKEALTNALRHAAPSEVRVRVRAEDGHLEIGVEDDGRGFGAAAAREGDGLGNMRERSTALGGELRVAPRAGGGTAVTLRLSLRRLRRHPLPPAHRT